jgi:hypothetical protein
MLQEAKEISRSLPVDSADWAFYYGVQTAANHVLHAMSHAAQRDPDSWLRAESPSFRDGYLKASTALAIAGTAANPPLRVPVPQP